ncbi:MULTISPECIES: hypothetical protein [unclassified Psychrobacter]|uniref:hypothetical protein n=1 Tax=unclassified Psychrobacter TaxID=196806 RepID=UPI003FD0D615
MLGGSVKAAGKFVNNDFIQEIGESVDGSMRNTGNILGNVADGIAEVGIGAFDSDSARCDKGFSDLGKTTKAVGNQLLVAAGQIVGDTIDTADGLLERDWDKVKTSGRSLAKVVAVSTIAIGVVDAVDGVDTSGAESLAAADSSTVADSTQIENYNVHDVSPHERVLPNGDVIWVDGDGDTSVDRDTGWTQTNPNYRA